MFYVGDRRAARRSAAAARPRPAGPRRHRQAGRRVRHGSPRRRRGGRRWNARRHRSRRSRRPFDGRRRRHGVRPPPPRPLRRGCALRRRPRRCSTTSAPTPSSPPSSWSRARASRAGCTPPSPTWPRTASYWAALDVFTADEWGPWVDAYLDHDLGPDGRQVPARRHRVRRPRPAPDRPLDRRRPDRACPSWPSTPPRASCRGTSPLVQAGRHRAHGGDPSDVRRRRGAAARTTTRSPSPTPPPPTVADALVAHAGGVRAVTDAGRPVGAASTAAAAPRAETPSGVSGSWLPGSRRSAPGRLPGHDHRAALHRPPASPRGSFYDLFASREALLHRAARRHQRPRARRHRRRPRRRRAPTTSHARAVAAFTAYLEVITTDPRWVPHHAPRDGRCHARPRTRPGATPSVASPTSSQQELDRLAATGAIPEARPPRCTAAAVVGGLTALVESLLPPDEQPHAAQPAPRSTGCARRASA